MIRTVTVHGWHPVMASWLVLMCVSAWGAEPETPWPAEVPGFVAPKSGEHPRLFFQPRLRCRGPRHRHRPGRASGRQLETRGTGNSNGRRLAVPDPDPGQGAAAED